MMGRFVICAFKPKAGKEAVLFELVEKHWRVLQEQDLVTSRPHYLMQGADGTIVEVFEWLSADAIQKAHHDPVVHALWTEFEAVSDYVPLSAVPESLHPFSEFQPLN